jgi:hypothetical protein
MQPATRRPIVKLRPPPELDNGSESDILTVLEAIKNQIFKNLCHNYRLVVNNSFSIILYFNTQVLVALRK